MMDLSGKVALVSGGSRGIGAATVRLLCQAGARVVFSFQKAEDRAQALVAECGGEAVCQALQQALFTVEDGGALVTRAAAVYGRLDILVVNHGVWPPQDQPVETMPAAQWRDTLGINLDSAFGMVRAAAGQMLRQVSPGATAGAEPGRAQEEAPKSDPAAFAGAVTYEPGMATPETQAEGEADARELLEEVVYSDHITWPAPAVAPAPAGEADQDTSGYTGHAVRGHIVLVASTAAQRGEAFHADYAASKGALLSLTKSLSSELGPQGILCNCIAPGWVQTEMSAGTLRDPAASKKALGLIPLGRAADPEEIAGPIVFLCTPWAGFVSGEIWNVNGGAVLVG